MNIKSISNLIQPLDPVREVDPIRQVRSNQESSADRDPNGHQHQDKSPEKRQLTDTEFSEALQRLQDLPGFSAHQLRLRVETRDHRRWVVIESADGRPVRRLHESDLLSLLSSQDQSTGQIYRKAL